MATFVLVHGGNISTDTWNRLSGRNTFPPGNLLGPHCWDGTAAYLREHDHEVFTPQLPDEHTHNLTDHIGRVCSLIRNEDLWNVLLVGHSYGGMVITGVAAALPKRVRRLVYVDAALPDPGQSLFDLFLQGDVDPLSFPGLEAASAYVEKIRFDPKKIRPIAKTYIRCTKSEFSAVTRLSRKKAGSAGDSAQWTCCELPSSHVPMADIPKRFNQVMLSLADR